MRRVLVYDEGLLWVLAEMRREGKPPNKMHFKLSARVGHDNPASSMLLEDLGADSINPVRDLSLPTIVALRQTVKVPSTFTPTILRGPAGSPGCLWPTKWSAWWLPCT